MRLVHLVRLLLVGHSIWNHRYNLTLPRSSSYSLTSIHHHRHSHLCHCPCILIHKENWLLPCWIPLSTHLNTKGLLHGAVTTALVPKTLSYATIHAPRLLYYIVVHLSPDGPIVWDSHDLELQRQTHTGVFLVAEAKKHSTMGKFQ